MRRFLYITPYFAPQSRVGALRPLKFVRHLPALGWDPVVLADLRRDDATVPALWDAVPADVAVHFDYSHVARANFERFVVQRSSAAPKPPPPPASPTRPKASTSTAVARTGARRPSLRWSPEYVPLGEHSIDIPWAYRAGARLLDQNRDLAAIVVNADPYAALIVGAMLQRRSGLPLLLDLRDPWSVCDLRRPERPGPQRALVDAMERWCVERSSVTIVNSEATEQAYRAHYGAALADRFAVIRNHADPELVSGGTASRGDRFTMLYLGTFRRHLDGDVMFKALGELRRRGLADDALTFVVTGRLGAEARALVAELGIGAWVEERAPVAYTQILPVLDSADLLVCQSNESRLRIPAKLYDYALSVRPMLMIADGRHDELRRLTTVEAGGVFADMRDVTAVADAMQAALRRGRGVERAQRASSLTTAAASAQLVRLLDRAWASRSPEPR